MKLSFLGISWAFGVNQKSPKISTNTYRMILFLRQFNSMGETLQLGCRFGAWQNFFKKPVGFKYFPFPYEIWTEINKEKGVA